MREMNHKVVLVTAIGLILSTAIAFRIYHDNDRDITSFIAFGDEDPVTAAYGERALGDVYLRDGLGHDGRFFFIQANDPWLNEPSDNAGLLDLPIYRSQRMFYPLLAGGLGLFSAETIVWAMLVVNLLAAAGGTLSVANIAAGMGGSPWWGLAFPLNIGLISEMSINSAGVVAAAAGFAGIALLAKERIPLGILALTAAALSREVMLLVCAGTAVWYWTRGRRRLSVLTLAIPVFAVGLWAAFIRLRLDLGSGVSEVNAIGWPFVGIARAFARSASGNGTNLVVGVVVLLLIVFFTRRVLRERSLFGWSMVGIGLLAFFLTEQVWLNYFDISRAIAPVLTAFVVIVMADGKQTRRQEHDVGHRSSD